MINVVGDDGIDEMFAVIDECMKEEQQARNNLQSIMDSSGETLDFHLSSIDDVFHQTKVAEQRAHVLSVNIQKLHENADAVSSKVRQTHLVMGRVKEVIEAIEGNIGMKSCLQGVEEAINDEDYEKASTLVSRVYALSQKQKQREEEIDNKSLEEAQTKIRNIVQNKFKESIRDENQSDIDRFGKLFAPLRMEKAGLEVYCQHLIKIAKSEIKAVVDENWEKIADLKIFSEEDSDNEDMLDSVTFVDLLRKVFDVCAVIIEDHESFIAHNFGGTDKIIYLIQLILSGIEQYVNRILDSFSARRKLKERASQIDSYKYRSLARQSSVRSRSNVDNQTDNQPDPKELDLILEELAHLCQYSLVFEQFTQNKAKHCLVGVDNPEYSLPRISNITIKMQQLMGDYIPLDEYFIKQSISKAIQVNRKETSVPNDSYGREVEYEYDVPSESDSSESESEEDDEDLDDGNKCSPLIDDIFYILQKSLNRAVSTHEVSVICAIVNNINTILTTGNLYDELNKDLLKITDKRGEMYPLYVLKQIMHSFNDMEMTSSYVVKLKQELDKMIEQFSKAEQKQIKSCSDDLIKTSYDLSNIVERNIKRLVLSGLDNIVHESLQQLNHEVSYNLTDRQYNENAMRDPFVEAFTQYFEDQIHIYQTNLTKSNFDKLIQEILIRLCEKIEQILYQKRFNQLGSWQFDKDLRSIMNYFTGKTQSTIRDKFARLTQIAFLLKMTSCEEVLDYWGEETGMNWRLTPKEVNKILQLRVEFDYNVVNTVAAELTNRIL